MKLKPFTLRWDDDARAFDTSPLDAFMAEHDVLSVFEHFFVHDTRPGWALLLGYRPRTGPPLLGPASDAPAGDPRAELAPEDRKTFEALRAWRNQRAREEGKPAYVLFTNNQMIAIARARPRSKTALGAIHGVGEAKLSAYGDAVLQVLGAVSELAPEPPADPGASDHA